MILFLLLPLLLLLLLLLVLLLNTFFTGVAAARVLVVPQPVRCGKPSSMLLRDLRQVAQP